jgi:ATP-dependent DNA helicase DinG
MEASERFTAQARARLKDEIEKAGGNEVFAACRLDEDGLVRDLIIAARGNKSAVPALAPYLEKGDALVHNHPSGTLEPSDADMAVASRVGDTGVGFYIVDNELSEVYVVAEAVLRRNVVPLDADSLAGLIEEGGPLAARIKGYESRKSQVDLLKLVAKAFNQNAICAAEAGTGVGKSFAYLLPAMTWASKNKERVVISTATINLQEQLLSKDIPAVNALFKKQVKAVLVKGRANYLCRMRLKEALDEEGLFADAEESELHKIALWADVSPSGSKSDLPFMPEDGTWARICSEADFCLNMKCAHRDACFVIAMRREAADSQVLVTNHHLLFSDLSARLSGAGYENTAVLPPFSRIVIDEAHNIEGNATSYFSYSLNRFSVFKQLGRLFREKGGHRYGCAVSLQRSGKIPAKLFGKLPERIAGLRQAVSDSDAMALDLLGEEPSFRITETTGKVRKSIFDPLSALERAVQGLLQTLQEITDAAPEELSDDLSLFETKIIMIRLAETVSICSMFLNWESSPDRVFWLSRERTAARDLYACFNATPLNVSGMMQEAVYAPFQTVACVSATLTVGQRFNFWESRVGISGFEDKEILRGVFPSPFPFKTNVLLCVPRDAPAPDDPAYHAFVSKSVRSILELSGGHGLVLFTSYEALRRCYEEVRPALEAIGVTSFKQGDDERSRLMEHFKADSSSVLFATDSFWEGIDAPGDTLQVVIIAKLPFKVPTDAVQKARAEAIEKAGGNSFMDMSLPEAVMKLKQGFGRLMRRSDDRGCVAILDSRLVTKRYGGLFLDSLPDARRSIKPLAGILEDLESFLYG